MSAANGFPKDSLCHYSNDYHCVERLDTNNKNSVIVSTLKCQLSLEHLKTTRNLFKFEYVMSVNMRLRVDAFGRRRD